MSKRLEDRIRELAEPLADEQGLNLYDLQVTGGKRLVVRLRIERKSKQDVTDGVTIDECATMSRRLEHCRHGGGKGRPPCGPPAARATFGP